MPQLVKGGKYVFAWSKVGKNGRIVIPDEAIQEYNFKTNNNVILMPGSKRSGGFGLTNLGLLKNSHLAVILEKNPQLAKYQVSEGGALEINGRTYCWVKLQDDGSIIVPIETLKRYGVNPGDCLLGVRGSNIAIGFPVRGPIIEEAKRHPELELFE
jgi:bifunctional DNA-binding transcriptional regulator/antitoxin component of YhaV-PrlF toxin-antitoxin module